MVEEPNKIKTPEPKGDKSLAKAKESESSEEPDDFDGADESDSSAKVFNKPDKLEKPEKTKEIKMSELDVSRVASTGGTEHPVKLTEEFEKRCSSQLEDQVAGICKEKKLMCERELELL